MLAVGNRGQAERLAIAVSERQLRPAKCPAEFATTDRVCQRWASSVGMGVQSDKWQDNELRSRAPPLDDDVAIVVDQTIMRLPERTKRIIVKWYRTDIPSMTIAEQLNLTPRTLVTAWHISLNFLLHKLLNTNHKGVLELLRFRE
jgi:hypothetical protein